MNETMRPAFYSGRWKAEECVPYSIFLSQGDYPLKGFHYVLRALPEILRSYPRACVYVAGADVMRNESVMDEGEAFKKQRVHLPFFPGKFSQFPWRSDAVGSAGGGGGYGRDSEHDGKRKGRSAV